MKNIWIKLLIGLLLVGWLVITACDFRNMDCPGNGKCTTYDYCKMDTCMAIKDPTERCKCKL